MAGSRPGMPGIHHVIAICGDPQRNVDFYVGLLGLLGLRLVKRTVNFDDPGTYHLYYGDGLGSPGTIMTFFAWILPPMVTAHGRRGTGQITAVPFRTPASSLDFWIDRLAAQGVDFDGPEQRFDERVLALRDPDGLPLELVARTGGTLRAAWPDGPIPVEHAIRGFAWRTPSAAAQREWRQVLSGAGVDVTQLRRLTACGDIVAQEVSCPTEQAPSVN